MDNQVQVNTQPQTEEVFYSFPEAAEKLGVTVGAISHWLKKYPQIREQYVQKNDHKGRYRWVITSEGLVVVAYVKDGNRGNQFIEPSSQFREAKHQIVKKALAKRESSQEIEILKDMVNKQSSFMEKQAELIETLAGVLKSSGLIKPIQLQLTTTEEKPPELTYRQRIGERVNAYARENGIDHKEVRGHLYYKFYHVYRINLKVQAKNEDISQMDVLEKMGKMKEAWTLACDILKLKGE